MSLLGVYDHHIQRMRNVNQSCVTQYFWLMHIKDEAVSCLEDRNGRQQCLLDLREDPDIRCTRCGRVVVVLCG